ncbi:coagulation factor X-like [Apus apus]|uniref:coagulation factor X-like n=1 Tax=Apus apus TaxID=8895 RepID=UPI0021F87217|nr:coagulation factor X-like [Apus apus]
MAMAGHRGTVWLLPVVLLFLQMVQTVIPNACRVNNGNCEQFCKVGDEGVVCSCAAGYALGNDSKTCIPVVKFPCGKLQRNQEAGQEKVTGTTASADAYPENEETTEAPSSHPEVTVEAGILPSASPWQAILSDEDDAWFCGGTILNEYFILTGASCISQLKDFQVLVGLVDKDKEEPSRARHRVKSIFIHANFGREAFDSDIALLRLEEPITFSEDVIPACLPEEQFANNILMNQTFGIVSGFGNTFERAQPVKRMKVLQIPYVDHDTCKLALRNPVTKNMFCAGYDKDGKDVCQGDGGGPHVTHYKGTYFVTGIISWGEGCGRQGKYGVYTKLSKFLRWVRRVLAANL